MQLHLFSNPQPFLRDIVEISRTYLAGAANPTILYVPPRLKLEYVNMTREVFAGLADLLVIDLSTITAEAFCAALERVQVLFVPGGNTFLLNQHIHQKGLYDPVRQAVLGDLPYVGFSAGALVCGPNMLTTNDFNASGSIHFQGFGFTPYNFLAHYPVTDGPEREMKDARVAAYHEFHDNPVLALEDDAYIHITAEGARRVRGSVWLFEKGKERQPFR